jgi:flagellar hook-length control protein FliK
MSRTNLDFLFQVTAPLGERTSLNAARLDGPGFGDHLSQASTATLGTPGRASDPPSAGTSPPHKSNESSNEAPRNETSSEAKSAAGDRNDRNRDESQDVVETDNVQASAPSGSSATGSIEAGDSDTDLDHDEAHSDEAVVAVAETVNNGVVAASPRPGESIVTENAATSAVTGSTADIASTSMSASEAESKNVPGTPLANDALSDNASKTSAEVVKAPTVSTEPIDETTKSKATKKLRPATPKTTTEKGQPSTSDEQLAGQLGDLEINGDATASHDATNAETETANAGPVSNESAQPERNGDSQDSDTNAGASARQRSDTTALAHKISTAAVVGAATQPESNVSREANDGASRAGKSAAAKVDSVGHGANRLHANAGTSKHSGRTSVADEMPRVDPARFVGRVAKAFHTAQERGGTLQIRLSPPELGAMRLELTVKDGVMTAALETETTSARRVLLEHLPALRDRLAEHNIRVEQFDVEVRREGANGQSDSRATQDQQHSPQGQSEQRRRPATQTSPAENARQARPSSSARASNTGINLVA